MEFKDSLAMMRTALATMVSESVALKELIATNLENGPAKSEAIANVTIAYRHLEDAAMRFGKAIQALSGGESPLGGPKTPGM